MKLAWTIGAAVIAAGVGIGSSSYAQTNAPDESSNSSASQPNSSTGAAESDSSSERMMGHGMMGGRMGNREGRYHDREMGGMGMRGHMGHEQFDQGAHFRFRRGDAMIDIRCPKDEEVASCVQAATRLMRAVKDMQNTGASSPTSSSPGPQGQ